jgi:hypothetical protein
MKKWKLALTILMNIRYIVNEYDKGVHLRKVLYSIGIRLRKRRIQAKLLDLICESSPILLTDDTYEDVRARYIELYNIIGDNDSDLLEIENNLIKFKNK